MSNLSIKRVLALPGTLAASTMYIVQATETTLAKLYFTNSDGSAVRHIIDKDDVTALIEATQLPDVITAGEYGIMTVNAKGIVVSGRSLIASDIPSLPGTKIISAISVDTTGNAATATLATNAAQATKLATPRNINGVAFDGTGNITINAVDATARIAATEKGAVNGVATLGSDGKVPADQLPSYVDDVIEVANFAALPGTGESSKIYVTVDNNKTFRWTGTVYIGISVGVGTADNALKLLNARTIAATGDITFSVSFDGSANVSGAATLADVVEAGSGAVTTYNAKGLVTGSRALLAADIPSLDSTTVTSAASVAIGVAEW